MHRYASATPEARELISELEFVWDQIKANTPPSTSSSPVEPVNMPTPPHTSRHYDRRLSRSGDNDMGRHQGRDSRLRVLSPVSQPEDIPRRRGYEAQPDRFDEQHDEQGREGDEDEDEDEEDEEDFQEARNSFYDEEEQNEDPLQRVLHNGDANGEIRNRRWRRRVEQALTKMTAEIAAMREQMESRANYNRRRTRLWTWLRWLVWVTIRQVCWDLLILGAVYIWMRLGGGRRLHERLKLAWSELRKRLAKVRFLRYLRLGRSMP